jgi:hypothetical protein
MELAEAVEDLIIQPPLIRAEVVYTLQAVPSQPLLPMVVEAVLVNLAEVLVVQLLVVLLHLLVQVQVEAEVEPKVVALLVEPEVLQN